MAGRDRRARRALGLLRQPGLARALPVEPGTGCSRSSTTARAPTPRPRRAIQRLLGVEREPVAPLRPEDEPRAPRSRLRPEDVEGAYSGPYAAGGVWAVLSGAGTVSANGAAIAVEHPGCYALIEHERHTAGVLELELGDGVTCHAVCFTPGVAG